MSTKREITPEMLEAYERFLSAREVAVRAEIARQEKHLKRIEAKRLNPESSLRSDLREKTAGVFKALGLEIPTKEKKPFELEKKKFEPGSVVAVEIPEEITIKKSSEWENWK